MNTRPLRRTEAAEYITNKFGIPCSPKTLAKLASIGSDGPPFRKAGRYPLYSPQGLDEWALAKIGPEIRGTAELRQAA